MLFFYITDEQDTFSPGLYLSIYVVCQDGHSSSKDRVAAFIDNLSGQVAAPPQHLPFPDQSEPAGSTVVDPSDDRCSQQPQHRQSGDKETWKTSTNSGSRDESPRWEFLMDADQLELFLSAFQLAKNRLKGKGFPV